MILGVVNGVVLCEAGGFPPARYVDALGSFMAMAGAQAQRVARTAVESGYRETEAALRTWAGGLEHTAETLREAGASDEVPRFLGGLLERAIDAGHGEHDIAALVEVLRKAPARR
jgi:3-hydroxyisobutyrate dehydrogenase-like beta-hydroxyacid dehydrogenase